MLFNAKGKTKTYNYEYSGLFDLGDTVYVMSDYLPREFIIDKQRTITIKPTDKGRVSRKQVLEIGDIRGGAWLNGRKCVIEYAIEYDLGDCKIVLENMPEWLISDSPDEEN